MTTTHKHSTFQEFEVLEKRLLIGLFNHQDFTVDDFALEPIGNYCTTDGEYTVTTTDHRFEAKVRDISVHKYPDHFIELKKIKELLEYVKVGYKIEYIMFFQESYGYSCIVYNLSARFKELVDKGIKRIPTYDKWLPSHTAQGGSRNYEYKPVMKLILREDIDTFIKNVEVYEGYISDFTQPITPESTIYITNNTITVDNTTYTTNDSQ